MSNYAYDYQETGSRIYVRTRSRAKATQYITDNYGRGFFKLRTFKIEKTNKPLSVRGTATR